MTRGRHGAEIVMAFKPPPGKGKGMPENESFDL
jgi:hypothetical protein